MRPLSLLLATAAALAALLAPAAISQDPLTLSITQRGGEGSVEIRNENGDPDAIYFTAISFLPENDFAPGTGWWGGLHISFPFLLQQAQSGVPFAGFLDSSGSSSWSLPAGSLPPNLPTLHAVTRTFGPFLTTITETSNIASLTSLPAPTITVAPTLSTGPVTPAVPLVRTIDVTTDMPTQVELIIDDGPGNPKTVLADPEFKTQHVGVPVLGMRAGRTVSVTVVVRNQNGTPSVLPAQELTFDTDPLPADFPPMQVTRLPQAGEVMEPGVTIFPIYVFENPTRGYLVMVDENGEVIWYFDGQQNSLTLDRLFSFQPLSNGNLTLMAGNLALIEITRTGEQVGAWWASGISGTHPQGTIPVPVDTFHHELEELPPEEEGDFLLLSTVLRQYPNYPTSETDLTQVQPTGNVISDSIVEFKRDGTVVREMDFFDLLDPYRLVYDSLGGFWSGMYSSAGDTDDWTHGNAVFVDTRDDSYIASLRHQDAVIKIDRQTGDLKWILGPPDRWKAPWSDALLTPKPGVEWNFHQHAPEITVDGNLLIFDNGNHRAVPPDTPMPFAASYSRAVEFRIDEVNKTVEQAWTYGGPTDPQHMFHSFFLGDADRLPVTGNVLVCDGGKRFEADPGSARFGRIVEVTHTTPPVEIFEIFIRDESPMDKRSVAVYRAGRIPSVYPH